MKELKNGMWTRKVESCQKEHKCQACGKTIRRGQSAEYREGEIDGEYRGWWICEDDARDW